jgi:MFS family permease
LGAEVDVIAYLTGRYFGLRAFGKVYSSLFASFALAAALGPLIMGAGFDRLGSYRGVLVAFFVGNLLAAFLITCLGPYRYRPSDPAENNLTVQLQTEDRRCGA